MNDWLDFDTYAALIAAHPECEMLTAYGSNAISRPVQGQTYRQLRERVTAAWKITGLAEDTTRMLVNLLGAVYQQNAAFPDVGAFLVLSGNPAEDDTTISIVNLRPSADGTHELKTGWKFQIFGDDTIYTVDADATLPTQTVDETDEQIKAPPSLYLTYGVDYDPAADKVFYANYKPSTSDYDLRKCDSDGSNDASVITHASTFTPGHFVALDPDNSHVYYTWRDSGGSYATIRRVNYDGTGDTLIYTSAYASATGLLIDADNGYLYIWNQATSVTRTTLAGASATTMYTGAVRSVGVKPGAALYVQKSTGNEMIAISEAGTQTDLADLDTPLEFICHDESDGGFFGVETSDNNLLKYNSAGEELYERVDFLGANPESIIISQALGKFVYGGGTQGTRKIGTFTTAVTVTITPALSDSAAIANGAEIYFFMTESCQGNRANEAHGWTVNLRGKYETRWVHGPTTEEVA